MRQTGIGALVVAGGVGANRRLRAELAAAVAAAGGRVHYPRPEFCTDNAAMIALAGHARLAAGEREALPGSRARALATGRSGRAAALRGNVDKIFLTSLSTEAVIGIFDWEREVKQRIEIDLEMSLDLTAAGKSDSIDDTLNYKSVAKRVLAFVGASRFQLVESTGRAHREPGARGVSDREGARDRA